MLLVCFISALVEEGKQSFDCFGSHVFARDFVACNG